jgi:hypothetical protein
VLDEVFGGSEGVVVHADDGIAGQLPPQLRRCSAVKFGAAGDQHVEVDSLSLLDLYPSEPPKSLVGTSVVVTAERASVERVHPAPEGAVCTID